MVEIKVNNKAVEEFCSIKENKEEIIRKKIRSLTRQHGEEKKSHTGRKVNDLNFIKAYFDEEFNQFVNIFKCHEKEEWNLNNFFSYLQIKDKILNKNGETNETHD